jgi:glycosyltransferase involved in cell wall biosynthesis
MKKISVSIIVPAYNAEKYIAQTIQSVFEQTYTDWELIIIDDGSIDKTAIIIKEFLTDDRIKYFHQKNRGVSAARNTCIEHSNGKYIAFLDADDVWEPMNLEKKISFLENNTEFDWIFSNMYYADEKLNKIGIAPAGTDKNILEKILLWEGEVVPGPCSNLVIRRKCIEHGISFDANLTTAADQDYCIQLAKLFRGKHIPEALWCYRIIPTSMSRNLAAMEHDHIYVYKKASRLNLFKSYGFRHKCFSNLYLILAGSWWVNGNNKFRGIKFICLALLVYPPNFIKLIKKIF